MGMICCILMRARAPAAARDPLISSHRPVISGLFVSASVVHAGLGKGLIHSCRTLRHAFPVAIKQQLMPGIAASSGAEGLPE
jgi:hypothetical protein